MSNVRPGSGWPIGTRNSGRRSRSSTSREAVTSRRIALSASTPRTSGTWRSSRSKSERCALSCLGQALALDAVVRLAGRDVLELLGAPIGPRQYYSVYAVALTDAKGHWQFGLREIARSAPHHPGL